MAKLNILVTLATAILSLDTFQAQARPHQIPATSPITKKYHPLLINSASRATTPLASKKYAAALVDEKNYALGPEPYMGFYDFVDKCLEKMSNICSLQIFSVFLGEDNEGISDECCQEMLEMGLICETEVVKAAVRLAPMLGEVENEIAEKDAQIWSQCLMVTLGT